MAPQQETTIEGEVEAFYDDRIRCLSCRTVVTNVELAVERSGAHQHLFRNPDGYSFHIRCFRDASGCASEGELTTAATWFPGYAWSFALCKGCEDHLGWWYVGSGPSFIALIATRIV